ncbi:MAG: DUF2214 family protein [Pseudomonadota bacterium]
MLDILIRYAHLAAVLVLAVTLIIENMAMAPQISKEDVRNLLKVDAAYGLSAVVVLSCGLLLWFTGAKPSSFYSSNPVFHAKLGLFVVVGLLSIYPTVFLIRNRKNEAETLDVPIGVRRVLRLELLLLVFIPILAFLMARGIGL